MFRSSKDTILITGDWLVARLSRYSNVWDRYFVPFNMLNFVIGGGLFENIFINKTSYY